DSTRRAQRDSARAQRCKASDTWVRHEERADGTLTVAVRVPCDTTLLAKSPDLPKSIYDPGEELFGAQDRDELMKTLNFGLQSGWAPQLPVTEYGFSQTRYNRVEGLSSGLTSSMQLGGGYAVNASARFGLGDKVANGSLGATRTNGRTTWHVEAYQR